MNELFSSMKIQPFNETPYDEFVEEYNKANQLILEKRLSEFADYIRKETARRIKEELKAHLSMSGDIEVFYKWLDREYGIEV